MHGLAEVTADIFAEQRTKLRVGFGGVKTPKSDSRYQPFTIPVKQRARERMSSIQFGFAIASDDQRPLVPHLPQQMAQQPEGATVSPMEIVGIKE